MWVRNQVMRVQALSNLFSPFFYLQHSGHNLGGIAVMTAYHRLSVQQTFFMFIKKWRAWETVEKEEEGICNRAENAHARV